MNAIKKRESLSSDMIPMQDGNQIISRITMKADTPSYRSQQISTSCKIIRIRYVLLWLKGLYYRQSSTRHDFMATGQNVRRK